MYTGMKWYYHRGGWELLPSAESNLHSLSVVFHSYRFRVRPAKSNVEATIRRKFRVSLLKLDESNLVTGIGNILCQEKLELAALSDRRKGWKLERWFTAEIAARTTALAFIMFASLLADQNLLLYTRLEAVKRKSPWFRVSSDAGKAYHPWYRQCRQSRKDRAVETDQSSIRLTY